MFTKNERILITFLACMKYLLFLNNFRNIIKNQTVNF